MNLKLNLSLKKKTIINHHWSFLKLLTIMNALGSQGASSTQWVLSQEPQDAIKCGWTHSVSPGISEESECSLFLTTMFLGSIFSIVSFSYIISFRFRVLFVHFIPCMSLVILNILLFVAMKDADRKRQRLLNSKHRQSVTTTANGKQSLGKPRRSGTPTQPRSCSSLSSQ